ncbi:MAG: KpsF/GutQ family sugar-phosphate isomerase [Proteobacteria bacterium]|nr:KpsF/GutQ family sugar-phosphate isomerase [Pseudomonadota bacterium]
MNQTLKDKKTEVLRNIQEVISLEANALKSMAESVGEPFFEAISLLMSAKGKIVFTGVGKSGLIARKIAATMSSTGTVATFLHPSDGMHGDLGLLTSDDVVVAIGKSGESEELTNLIPAIKRLNAKIIAITSKKNSTLAQQADIVLHTPVVKEACPLDLAPTVSTTLALAVGDALAVTLMKVKNFQPEDFAKYHPGGKLGKRLSLRVADLMIPKEKCPILNLEKASIEQSIADLGTYGLGILIFCEKAPKLTGILTDGDIRRLLNRHRAEIFDLSLEKVINRNPVTIEPEMMAVKALDLMESHQPPLNVVPVLKNGDVVGVLRLHELLSVS